MRDSAWIAGLYQLFLLGNNNSCQFFHADPSDRITVCPPEIGHGYIQVIPLRDDLTLEILDYTFDQDIPTDAIAATKYLEFEFDLGGTDGGYASILPHCGMRNITVRKAHERNFKVEIFIKNPTSLGYIQRFLDQLTPQANCLAREIFRAIYEYHQGITSTSINNTLKYLFASTSISIPKPRNALSFEQIISEEVYADLSLFVNAFQCPITPNMQALIGDILSCPYQKSVRRCYLEKKAHELINAYFDAIFQLQDQNAEMKMVLQAATILHSQLTDPPSLDCLARLVGTNRLTLNRSFRQLFGTTPFGYLRDIRVAQARRLLMTTELSITEVAEAVGYNSRSRFATAFRENMGINPKAFQMKVWCYSDGILTAV